jgi:polysaccharide export outer membrane protein
VPAPARRLVAPYSPSRWALNRKKLACFLALASLAFSASAGQQDTPSKSSPKDPPSTEASDAKSAPAENSAERVAAATGPVDPHTYVIGPEDILVIKVWREPDLSGQMLVRPDGRISLPLIQEVQAAGLTPEQLTKTIAEGLSKYMNQPEVSVAVQQVNSKVYFIQGEVMRPGKYPLLVPTTALQALVNAGGFQEFANRKKIVIMRGNERLKLNYNDLIKGKNMEQNIILQNGDLIIVP